MFFFKICSLSEFPQHKHAATHIVSCVDGINVVEIQENKQHVISVFHDHETQEQADMVGETLATQEQINQILKVTATLKKWDFFLVHCHGGICRSSAIAFLALVQHGFSPETAMKNVINNRPQAFPNLWVVELGQNFLGRNDLVPFMKKWQDENMAWF